MALRLRDLLLHPVRRGTATPRAAQKDSRAIALDSSMRMGSYGYSLASPKLKDYQSYLACFKSVPWVRACVQVIAYNAANIDFRLVKPVAGGGGNDNEDEEILDSPFLSLITKPNPYQSGFAMREAWWTDLELTGNAYIELAGMTPRGLPTEMYRLNPARMTVLPDRHAFIAGYRYTVNGRSIDYAPEDILHLKYSNPLDDFYGMGTIEAGEGRFESEMAMVNHERNFWQSGAKITGLFGTDESLDDSTFTRLTDRMRAFFQGSGYSTMLLENGLKYQSVSDSPAKLGMLEMQLASRDQIFAMFGVPPTKLGILERANYKADEADRFFWTETVGPKLSRVEDGMQALINLFHPGTDLKLRFKRVDFTDDVPQMTVAKLMSEVGVYTADEIRAYTGRDPMPDDRGELVMALQSTVPLDMGGPMATVNERRLDQGLPKLDGGDFTIILPRGAVPLDVKDEPPAIEPKIGQEPAPGQPSNVVNMRPQPAAAGKAVTRTSTILPATALVVQQHRNKALEHTMATYQPMLKAFFAEQMARVLARLAGYSKRAKASITGSGLWDDGEEDALLGQTLDPLWTTAIEAGVATAKAVGVPIKGESAARMQQLKQGLADRVVGINGTTRDALSEQLQEGLRRGYSAQQIAHGVPAEDFKGIQGVFAGASDYRAETIARTEMTMAYNTASLRTYRDSGVVERVEMRDGTHFDSICADRDGQVVPLEEAEGIRDHPRGQLAFLPLMGSSVAGLYGD